MSLSLAIAIYVVIWWTVLFAVLPIGVRTQGEDGAVVPGTPESAPSAPRLLRVVLLTTLISAAAVRRRLGRSSDTGSVRPGRDPGPRISTNRVARNEIEQGAKPCSQRIPPFLLFSLREPNSVCR